MKKHIILISVISLFIAISLKSTYDEYIFIARGLTWKAEAKIVEIEEFCESGKYYNYGFYTLDSSFIKITHNINTRETYFNQREIFKGKTIVYNNKNPQEYLGPRKQQSSLYLKRFFFSNLFLNLIIGLSFTGILDFIINLSKRNKLS